MKKKIFFLSLVFLFIGFFLSFKSLSSPLLFGDMDGYKRANWGYHKYASGQLLNFNEAGGAWLPFHPTILGLSILFFKDPVFSPRLITLIFSVFSIPLMYLYTRELFINDKRKEIVAIVATFIYLIHPFRLFFATQPLSEPVSMFFFLLILLFLSQKKLRLFLIIFFINLASAIRFEFWYFIPIIWLVFFTNKYLKKQEVVIASALCLVFPFYWLFLNYSNFKSPFYFFSNKYRNAQKSPPQIPYYNFFLATRGWIDSLIEVMSLTGIGIAFYGILNFFKKETFGNLIFVLLPFYFLLLLIIQVFLGTMEWLAPRYLFPVVITLIPFLSYGLIQIIQILSKKKKNIVFFLLLITISFFSILEIYGFVINVKKWRQAVLNDNLHQVVELVNFYETQRNSFKEIIYVTSGDWVFPMFIYLSQRHDVSFLSTQEYSAFSNSDSMIILHSSSNSQCKNKTSFSNYLFSVCLP